ncbi:cysteine desulfurase [Candidatus Bathyarchaeota archaeon]|nr:cysteine desulfurase [Candidatus Bathyarchaeota archaeon]
MDYNATTPIDPQVLEAMLPYLRGEFGNPSSSHVYGRRAHEAVVAAREKTAALIGCEPDEVVFTSSGSESNNQAIIGTAIAHRGKGHIVTSQTEHPAVLKTCRYLQERLGYKVTYLPVDKFGIISTEDLEKAITDETVLVTIMHANNETGTIQPNEKIGKILEDRNIPFHTDAAQSCGKTDVDVDSLKVDLLTIAGHKLYAPKGIGALYVRDGTQLDSLIHGGGQEQGRRAGTENVPYIVGLGKACEIAKRDLPDFKPRTKVLREGLYQGILDKLGGDSVILNGHPEERLPNTLNLSFKGLVGEELLKSIPEIAASTGSACHSGSMEPSPVLTAMGLSGETALGAVRFSLGRWTTKDEVDHAIDLVSKNVSRIRLQLKA